MNDSNQSLRFSRSYTEATGQRIRASDFDAPTPIITGREALFWLVAVAVLSIIVYIIKGV